MARHDPARTNPTTTPRTAPAPIPAPIPSPAATAPDHAADAEIRRHQRLDIALPARLLPIAETPGARPDIRFTSSAPAGPGGLELTAVDLSDGGIGFLSPIMLPRNATFQARVLAPPGAITTSLIETRVLVRRCKMIDRKPTFLIGTAFVEQSSLVREKVARARGILTITGPEPSRNGTIRAGKGAA